MFERSHVLQARHASRRIHRPGTGFGHVFHERQVGALHEAFEVHRRDQHTSQGQSAQRFHKIDDIESRRLCPAARDHPALAHIGRDDQPAGKPIGHFFAPIFVFHGACTNHHPLGTVVDQSFDTGFVTHPTADLHGHHAVAQQVANEFVVLPTPGGGVEIDDVHARETRA